MAEDEIKCGLCRMSMEVLQELRRLDLAKHGAEVCGVPAYFARWPEGGIATYPQFRLDEGYLECEGDQVFYVQRARIDLMPASPPGFGELWRVTAGAGASIEAARQKEHRAQAARQGTTLIGGLQDPIVSMVEFKGRLWVATTKGVFVKRANEDAFDQVQIYEMKGAVGVGKFNVPTERAKDEAAGLVPLHPNQTAEHADPFVPNRFGEHG